MQSEVNVRKGLRCLLVAISFTAFATSHGAMAQEQVDCSRTTFQINPPDLVSRLYEGGYLEGGADSARLDVENFFRDDAFYDKAVACEYVQEMNRAVYARHLREQAGFSGSTVSWSEFVARAEQGSFPYYRTQTSTPQQAATDTAPATSEASSEPRRPASPAPREPQPCVWCSGPGMPIEIR